MEILSKFIVCVAQDTVIKGIRINNLRQGIRYCDDNSMMNDRHVYYIHNYIDGELHGVNKAWFYNGKLYYERNYSYGKFHGLHQIFYRSGDMHSKKLYHLDKPIGVAIVWSLFGEIISYTNHDEPPAKKKSRCIVC